MTPDLHRRVQRYGWDRAVDYYEGSWRDQLEPAQRRLLEMADLRPGDRVLDIAAGTGLVTFPAAQAVGPDGSVLATDISERMVAYIADRAERSGISQVRAARMDAENLDVPDDSVDVALCGLGMMYFPDPLGSLRESMRVLAPGGRAVSAVWGRRERCGWAGIFPVVDARVNTDVCPLFFDLGTGDTLERMFAAAGFESVESRRIDTTLHYEGPAEAIRAAFAGGPVAMAYSRFDETTRRDAERAYLTTIDEFRVGDRYEIPGEFVVASGQKPTT